SQRDRLRPVVRQASAVKPHKGIACRSRIAVVPGDSLAPGCLVGEPACRETCLGEQRLQQLSEALSLLAARSRGSTDLVNRLWPLSPERNPVHFSVPPLRARLPTPDRPALVPRPGLRLSTSLAFRRSADNKPPPTDAAPILASQLHIFRRCAGVRRVQLRNAV